MATPEKARKKSPESNLPLTSPRITEDIYEAYIAHKEKDSKPPLPPHAMQMWIRKKR